MKHQALITFTEIDKNETKFPDASWNVSNQFPQLTKVQYLLLAVHAEHNEFGISIESKFDETCVRFGGFYLINLGSFISFYSVRL